MYLLDLKFIMENLFIKFEKENLDHNFVIPQTGYDRALINIDYRKNIMEKKKMMNGLYITAVLFHLGSHKPLKRRR